jgi:hypothetical protein
VSNRSGCPPAKGEAANEVGRWTRPPFFARSGWTQEGAGEEGGAPSIVDQLSHPIWAVLNFSTQVEISEKLSEKRFRFYWERTDKAETNERN